MNTSSELRLLARHAVVYGVGRVLDRAIGFVMLPVYTRYLTTTDYGALEIVYLTMTYVAMVIDVGLTDSIGRFYYGETDATRRDSIVRTGLFGFGGLGLAACLLLAPLARPAAALLLDDPARAVIVLVALAGLFFDIVLSVGLTDLRVRQRSVTLTLVSSAKLAVSLGLNILFVVVLERGVRGIVEATTISNGLFAVLLAAVILARRPARFDRDALRAMIGFGLPLIPSNVATNIVRSSDRFFLKAFRSLSDAGLYGLGYKFGMLGHQFLTTPFLQIWNPRRLELMGDERAPLVFARIFTYFVLLQCVAGLALAVFADELVRLLTTPSYHAAATVVPPIVLAHVVLSGYYHFYMPLLIRSRTGSIAAANLTTAAVTLGLNLALIPTFGMLGAAWATVAAYVVRVWLVARSAAREQRVEFEGGRVFGAIALAIGAYGASLWVPDGSPALRIAGKAAVCAAFPAALLLAGIFDRRELERLARRLVPRAKDAG